MSTVRVRSLHVDHAAAYLGVSRRTVYYWIQRGVLKTKRVGASQRVLAASLLDAPDRQNSGNTRPRRKAA